MAEHLEIAAYQLLERLAQEAGDTETAEVARQNRAEEEEMARRMDASWDRTLELTLEENGIRV
jgi:ferritin-like metal-binding protein YciE